MKWQEEVKGGGVGEEGICDQHAPPVHHPGDKRRGTCLTLCISSRAHSCQWPVAAW